MSSEKQRARKLKRNPWDTSRASLDTLQDKQGSTGRCPMDFLLFTLEKLTEKGIFAGTPATCPRNARPSSGVFSNFVRFFLCAFSQARNKSTKIKFLGPETARWGGGLPREGVVAENFVPALETLSSLGFEERNPGCPGNFAGMSRTPGGVQKVCAKKLRAHFSFPIFCSL